MEQIRLRRFIRQIAYSREFPLLSLCGYRPGRRTAEKGDEPASLHVLPQSEGCTLSHRGGTCRVVHYSKYGGRYLRRVIRTRAFRRQRNPMSAMPPIATKELQRRNSTRWAMTGLMQYSKWHRYSITSSARASKDSGMVSPSALAVFRLTTRSNLVGASTGMSSGLMPWRTLTRQLPTAGRSGEDARRIRSDLPLPPFRAIHKSRVGPGQQPAR